jgi:hypothetical protein
LVVGGEPFFALRAHAGKVARVPTIRCFFALRAHAGRDARVPAIRVSSHFVLVPAGSRRSDNGKLKLELRTANSKQLFNFQRALNIGEPIGPPAIRLALRFD